MVKTFLLSLAPTCNGVYRTCLLTPSATDTFRTVGVFHRVDHHLASLCTFSTVNAFFHIYTVAVNGNLIEYGIKCAKRTNITAKWSVNNNGKNNCHDQNCIFPYVQPANGTAHSLVQKYQRQSALQSSGRTDQLTEIGCSLAHYICEKQGKQNYKHQMDFQEIEQVKHQDSRRLQLMEGYCALVIMIPKAKFKVVYSEKTAFSSISNASSFFPCFIYNCPCFTFFMGS